MNVKTELIINNNVSKYDCSKRGLIMKIQCLLKYISISPAVLLHILFVSYFSLVAEPNESQVSEEKVELNEEESGNNETESSNEDNQTDEATREPEIKQKERSVRSSAVFGGTIGFGTYGFDISLGTSLSNLFNFSLGLNVRAGFSIIHIDKKIEYELSQLNFNINGNAKLQNISLLFDFIPVRMFRISTGVLFNLGTIDAVCIPNESKMVGVIELTPDDLGKLELNVAYNVVQPYLGIGVGNCFSQRRFNFLFDFGFVYQGKPEVSMNASGMIKNTQDSAQDVENVFSKHSFLHWYPRITLACGFNIL